MSDESQEPTNQGSGGTDAGANAGGGSDSGDASDSGSPPSDSGGQAQSWEHGTLGTTEIREGVEGGRIYIREVPSPKE